MGGGVISYRRQITTLTVAIDHDLSIPREIPVAGGTSTTLHYPEHHVVVGILGGCAMSPEFLEKNKK